tara:strand:+ start:123 stop:605 length:483 start_codon:yes stop_codon:yes gene_type:complete
MFTLGIPVRQYRRATQVLGHEAAKPIDYEERKQDDGFYVFEFPGVDEYDFKKIVLLLKGNGITTIGADEQLSEKNIMKLTNLLKEESPAENNFIDDIRMALEKNRELFNNPMFKTISDIIKNYEMGGDEERMMNMPENKITVKKLRKLIKDEYKRLSKTI